MNYLFKKVVFSTLSLTLFSSVIQLEIKPQSAIAQSSQDAVVFAPPSNIRSTPNGNVICSVPNIKTINVYGYENGWYQTDFCGGWGYIHESQIRLKQNFQATKPQIFCDVVNIKKGQLALRFSPNGKSRAGLNNGNTVKVLNEQGNWDYVRVMQGANSRVNGLEGWVNSNYLSCYDDI
jgi:Bacterial SH3 domain